MNYYKEQILTGIKQVQPEVHQQIMLCIVEYAYTCVHIKEIGIGDVLDFISNKYEEVDILLSLQKLCLLEYPLLEVNYELKENEDTYYSLTKSELKKAKNTGYLTHPYSGELLSMDIHKKDIYMYFKLINRV